jgi:hypothetical protein
MKRKFMMLGFAMLTGLPHAVCAKGFGKEEKAQSYASWNTPFSPHYGAEGAERPLMDHLSATVARNASSNWKMELSPPRVEAAERDSPMQERDKRFGVSFKLEF